jgi:hypothetical protein
MTETIAPLPTASGHARTLAALFTLVNVGAVLLFSTSLAAFLMGHDGENFLTSRITAGFTLVVVVLIIAATVFGWRRLASRPGSALLIMGAPGGLTALLMIAALVSASLTIGRMQAEMERTGRPPTVAP